MKLWRSPNIQDRQSQIGRRRFIAVAIAALAAACRPSTTSETTTVDGSTTTIPPSTTTTTIPTFDPIAAPTVDLDRDPFTLGVASGDPDMTSVVLWTRLIAFSEEPVPVVWELSTPDDTAYTQLIATGVVNADPANGLSLHVSATGLIPSSEYIYRFRVGDYVSPAGRTRTTSTGTEPVSVGVASCQAREAGFWQAHNDIAEARLDLMIWLGDYTYNTHGARTLDELRSLHATYRSDPALQAAHASCPWLVGLDDNDISNDYSSQGNDPDYLTAAYQAWWEHQPTRLPRPDGPRMDVYRHLDLGALVRVVLFDTRQYSEPGVDLLGTEQRAWADGAITSDPVYTIFASPVLVSELLPGSHDLLHYSWAAHSLDSAWLQSKFAQVQTPVVISGDLHTGLVTAVADSDGLPVAAELMAPAISSRLPDQISATAPLLPFANEFVEHLDPKQGWLRMDISADNLRATYRTTEAEVENDQVTASARFTVAPGAKQAIRQP